MKLRDLTSRNDSKFNVNNKNKSKYFKSFLNIRETNFILPHLV